MWLVEGARRTSGLHTHNNRRFSLRSHRDS